MTADTLHNCDECGGEFPEDEMSTLGGDVWTEGFAPQAVPAQCQGCAS